MTGFAGSADLVVAAVGGVALAVPEPVLPVHLSEGRRNGWCARVKRREGEVPVLPGTRVDGASCQGGGAPHGRGGRPGVSREARRPSS